jgi:hypothetical protein
MSQNTVIPNKDNKVIFVFSGVNLSLATDIKVQFGAELYTLALNPTQVSVVGTTELSLDLSSTAEVGKIFATVTYIDGSSINGTDITSRELGNSGQIVVAIGTQLIVEDGSQVTNSNSFVSDAEYKAYANLRGLTVAATQPDRETHLIAAMDYLKSIECNVQGRRVSSTQSLMFPRVDVWLYGYAVNSDVIPQEIKNAQMEAAAFSTSNEILTNSTNDNVKSEQVDTLKVEYFSGGSMNKVNMQRVNAQLSVLLQPSDKLVRT